MAKVTAPADIPIAALDYRAPAKHAANLMAPGKGTPWEDRGHGGLLVSFFRTCLMAMFLPRQLLWSIRHPEANSDAKVFACLCGCLGALAVAIHGTVKYVLLRRLEAAQAAIPIAPGEPPHIAVNTPAYVAAWAAGAVLIPAAVLLFVQAGSLVFYNLTCGSNTRGKAPPVLAYNVFGYSLAPVLVALIPLGYWTAVAALVWVAVLLAVGTIHRLRISPAAAIVNTLVVLGGMTIVVVLVSYCGAFMLRRVGPGDPVEHYVGPPLRQLVSPQGVLPK